MVDVAANFGGSVPEYYDSIMGPAQFEPFGADLARRLPAKPPGDVLEIACGTGRVTRLLRERLDPAVRLVASDISGAMLDYGRAKVAGDIDWREADACKLPFPDSAFGALLCAFGIMFVPDKALALREGGASDSAVVGSTRASPLTSEEIARALPDSATAVLEYVAGSEGAPTTLFVAVITTVGLFQVFAEPYVMTRGGPLNATTSVALLMYEQGFRWWSMGHAAAIAFVLFAMVLVVSALQVAMRKRIEGAGR